MPNLINEKEFWTEINISDVVSLFNLYTNPRKFFLDQGTTDVRGYDTNYLERFRKIFTSYDLVENQHKRFYSEEYFMTDVWGPFVFRGQMNTKWGLETSLYREFARLGPKKATDDLFRAEKMILREFRRQFNRFGHSAHIEDENYYEWFALMQHYGVPTRFLDFTYSFYVSLYFASLGATFVEDDTTSFSIFALNRAWLEGRYKEFLPVEIREMYENPTSGDSFGKSYRIQESIVDCKFGKFKAVINMSPFNLNSRQVNQRGLFLMPTDINGTFMENLSAMMISPDGSTINDKLLKINVQLGKADLIYLYKQLGAMNIGSQTLFETELDSLGEILRRKLIESRYSDILSLNAQQKIK